MNTEPKHVSQTNLHTNPTTQGRAYRRLAATTKHLQAAVREATSTSSSSLSMLSMLCATLCAMLCATLCAMLCATLTHQPTLLIMPLSHSISRLQTSAASEARPASSVRQPTALCPTSASILNENTPVIHCETEARTETRERRQAGREPSLDTSLATSSFIQLSFMPTSQLAKRWLGSDVQTCNWESRVWDRT